MTPGTTNGLSGFASGGKSRRVDPDDKVAVLVVGMHRSGTSALTRLLNLLGCDLPKTLMPAAVSNEKGHWESQVVADLNDAVLASVGMRWDDWRPFDRDKLPGIASEDFVRRAVETLDGEFGPSRLYVLKDPRLCRLLGLWTQAVRSTGVEPRIMVPIRNPLDVASSLARRNGMDGATGQLLWLRHVLDAEAQSRNLPRVFVRYEDVLADWRLVSTRIGRALNLVWPQSFDDIASQVDAFLSPSHQHHATPNAAVFANEDVAPWTRAAFAIFDRWCRDDIDPNDQDDLDAIGQRFGEAMSAFSPALEAAWDRAEGLAGQIDSLKAEIESAQSRIVEHYSRLARQETLLRERDDRIAALEKAVSSRDETLSAQEKTLAGHAAILARSEEHILQQEQTLKERARAIEEMGRRIVALESETTARMDALEKSNSEIARLQARIWKSDALTNRQQGIIEKLKQSIFKIRRWEFGRKALRGLKRLVTFLRRKDLVQTMRSGARVAAVRTIYSPAGYAVLMLARAVRTRSLLPLQNCRDIRVIGRSPLFDRHWYLGVYPEVRRRGVSPVVHYVAYGAEEGRDPSPIFSTRRYRAHNPDVAEANVNPLAHFILHGFREGRHGGLREHSDVLAYERALKAASQPAVVRLAKKSVSILLRILPARLSEPILLKGVANTIVARSEYFDADWYVARYPDVRAAKADPLWHYLRSGWRERRDPSPIFSTSFYLDHYDDVRASGSNPLVHYLLYGRDEGRATQPNADVAVPAAMSIPAHVTALQSKAARLRHRALAYVADRYGPALAPRYCELFEQVDRLDGEASYTTLGDDDPLLVRARAAAKATLSRQAGAKPAASIVIPMFNNVEVTLACVLSVLETEHRTAFEIIIADDCSTDPAAAMLATIGSPLRTVRPPGNLGFLRNCNSAAAQADGDYLVLLNNDTLVLPNWLDALIDVLAAEPGVGLVGSKLLNGDGTLQEAGGILWRDGSAWNFGRNRDPSLPEFNYRKSVDYISGASIALRRAVWQEVGGFDEAFAPAYCEDSDLALRLRAKGLDVVYQPRSELFHLEGYSHGRDAGQGIKAHQRDNQRKLFERWRDVLEKDHFANGVNVFEARDRSHLRPHILVVDHYVPQWDRDAGSRTMWNYLRCFVHFGFQVTFWPDNLNYDPAYTQALQDLGIEVIYSRAYFRRFREWFAERADRTRYVLLSRPNITETYMTEVSRHRGTRILYYGHDLHHKRMESEYKINPTPRLLNALEDMKELEQRIIRQVDVALYPSHDEVAFLRSAMTPTPQVEMIPAYVFDDEELARGAEAVERIGTDAGAELLFVGGFQHRPNVDGMVWFVDTVMPELRTGSLGVRLHIVGSNVTPAIAALATSDVIVHGQLSDAALAAQYETADLVIAPLRFGGGVKGKVIEAMAKGRPVATTSVGGQGIDDAGTMMFIGDEPQAFAAAIKTALRDRAEAKRRASMALAFVRRHYTMQAVRAVLAKFMPELVDAADGGRSTTGIASSFTVESTDRSSPHLRP